MTLPINYSFQPLGHGFKNNAQCHRKRDVIYKIIMAIQNVNLQTAINMSLTTYFMPSCFYSGDEAFIFINATKMVLNGVVIGMPGYGDHFLNPTPQDDHVRLVWNGSMTGNYNFENRTLRLFGRKSQAYPVRYLGKMTLIQFVQRIDNNTPARVIFQLDDITSANMHILPRPRR